MDINNVFDRLANAGKKKPEKVSSAEEYLRSVDGLPMSARDAARIVMQEEEKELGYKHGGRHLTEDSPVEELRVGIIHNLAVDLMEELNDAIGENEEFTRSAAGLAAKMYADSENVYEGLQLPVKMACDAIQLAAKRLTRIMVIRAESLDPDKLKSALEKFREDIEDEDN